MPNSYSTLEREWQEEQIEHVTEAMCDEFPQVRPDLISVAVRLSKREASPSDGISALVTRTRQRLLRRELAHAFES